MKFKLHSWLLVFLWGSHVISMQPGAAGTEQPSHPQVAVLDIETAGDTDQNWSSGTADFLEMELQKQGVVTLERRQIRLLLNERGLIARHLTTGNVRAARLPSVEFFIGGTLRRISATEFSLTISIINSKSATVETSFVENGNYPDGLDQVAQRLSQRVANALRELGLPVVENREFQSLTWMPEAALPFFRGMEFYARGDFPLAIAHFAKARSMDRNFVVARIWEARSYERAGFSQFAEMIRKKISATDIPSQVLNTNLPVVAVITRENISPEAKASFTSELAKARRFQIFEPQWIGASAREIDLQLTGQMVAPLLKKSVWLVIDEIIHLDLEELPNESKLRARHQRLVSGEELFETSISVTNREISNYATLAKKLLTQSASAQKPDSPDVLRTKNLEEPQAGDSPEMVFAKALRLVQNNLENPRYLIGLADLFFDWEPKNWLLDQAIEVIDNSREQKDAAFWLTSALWRKRMATHGALLQDSRAPHRRRVPLQEYFSKLLEWFPESVEAKTLAERPGPMPYLYGQPENRQYIANVFATAVVPHAWPQESTPTDTGLSDEAMLEKLRQSYAANDHGNAVALAIQLSRSSKPAIEQEARRIWSQAGMLNSKERGRLFAEFQKRVEDKEFTEALAVGSRFLDQSSDRDPVDAYLRQKVILACGRILEETKGAHAHTKFLLEQGERYVRIFGADLRYLTFMGEHAETMLAAKRFDLAAKIFEKLRDDPAVPIANRLTAGYDLAVLHYESGDFFAAMELLKEIHTASEGSGLGLSRKNGWSSFKIEDASFAIIRKIRLFADAELPLNLCCGQAKEFPVPTQAEIEETLPLLKDFTGKIRAGTEAQLSAEQVGEKVAEDEQRMLRVLVHQLRVEQDEQKMNHLLLFCAKLGTNGAPLVPHILPFAIKGRNQNNAVLALGNIGKPAACAVPIFILSGEEGNRNAESALHKVGPAPRASVPYLAHLLYHQNTKICGRAARAIIQSVQLDRPVKEISEEQILHSVRQWWETEGIKAE